MKRITILLLLLFLTATSAWADSDTFYLANSVDDTFGDSYYGTNNYTQTYANFGYYTAPTSFQDAYFRFNINIPKGSTITSAKLSLYGYSSLSGSLDAYVRSLTQSGSPAWRNGNGFSTANYANNAALDAIGWIWITVWDPVPAWTANNWYDTPDISDRVQEQIDDANYTPGDSVAGYVGYKIDRRSTSACSTCYRQCDTYDQGGGGYPAKLYVEWTLPPESVPKPIIIRR